MMHLFICIIKQVSNTSYIYVIKKILGIYIISQTLELMHNNYLDYLVYNLMQTIILIKTVMTSLCTFISHGKQKKGYGLNILRLFLTEKLLNLQFYRRSVKFLDQQDYNMQNNIANNNNNNNKVELFGKLLI